MCAALEIDGAVIVDHAGEGRLDVDLLGYGKVALGHGLAGHDVIVRDIGERFRREEGETGKHSRQHRGCKNIYVFTKGNHR